MDVYNFSWGSITVTNWTSLADVILGIVAIILLLSSLYGWIMRCLEKKWGDQKSVGKVSYYSDLYPYYDAEVYSEDYCEATDKSTDDFLEALRKLTEQSYKIKHDIDSEGDIS